MTKPEGRDAQRLQAAIVARPNKEAQKVCITSHVNVPGIHPSDIRFIPDLPRDTKGHQDFTSPNQISSAKNRISQTQTAYYQQAGGG